MEELRCGWHLSPIRNLEFPFTAKSVLLLAKPLILLNRYLARGTYWVTLTSKFVWRTSHRNFAIASLFCCDNVM